MNAVAGRMIYQAQSGLAAYDQALFFGAPPHHGPAKKSDFGYAALYQPRLREVPEVCVAGGSEFVLLMTMSSHHKMETWMDGRYQPIEFRRGDLVAIPPGMETRWCASSGQASAMHLHVSSARLNDAVSDEGCGKFGLVPGLAFRDVHLQRLMQKAARIDESDPLMPLKIASIGAAALLRLLTTPNITRTL